MQEERKSQLLVLLNSIKDQDIVSLLDNIFLNFSDIVDLQSLNLKKAEIELHQGGFIYFNPRIDAWEYRTM